MEAVRHADFAADFCCRKARLSADELEKYIRVHMSILID